MATSELGLRRARFAYERAHVMFALRGLAIAAGLSVVAWGLHRTSDATWLVAGALGATLAVLGWRGGAWRRGGFAGVLAGLPPLVAPSIVFALGHSGHCPDCVMGPTLPCLIVCFGTSSLVGSLVGYRATINSALPAGVLRDRPEPGLAINSALPAGVLRDRAEPGLAINESPRRYAIAAITSAALTGLLGCGTTGLGGAIGVVIGLVAGAVTGWVVGGRTAHA